MVSELAVVFNPDKITAARLEKLLNKHTKSKFLLLETDRETGGQLAAEQAVDLGAKRILVAGGDGTLRNVVQAVAGKDVAIGIIPIGTGNILARNLKIPLLTDQSIKRALKGQLYEIDLGLARAIDVEGNHANYLFTGIAGVGMDARLMQNTSKDRKKQIGWVAYIEGGIKSLPLKFERFDISFDGGERTLKSYSLLIGNAGWLPGALSMMPDARLDDGKLDVAAIGPRRVWNWVDFFSRITWQNKVVRPLALGRKWMDQTANVKTLENLSSSRIRIRPHNPALMQLDGDVIGEVIEVDFSLKPKALKVLL